MAKYYFAVDLGATSGRTILGVRTDDGNLTMEEINRFPNQLIHAHGHYYWDIYELYRNILEGLRTVAARGIEPDSIGIDTWGVDFVTVGRDGNLLRMPYSYRDPHTDGAPEAFFSRVSDEKVYASTGIQVMNFNSIFQLDTMRRNKDSALEAADKILFVPDALAYLLTGNTVTEYTIATTGQIVNAATRQLDAEILAEVGLSVDNFGKMVYPGETIGTLTPEVQEETGLGAVPVVAVGEHDTASAVAAVPAVTENFAYLSSGTWSLMGVETKAPVITDETRRLNITNEGGINGTIRLLKNICGMWLLERCRAQWGKTEYGTLISEAMESEAFRSLINPDDPMFANPRSMTEAICAYCDKTSQPVPETRGQFTRCIFESLALRYRQVMDMFRSLTDHPIDVLHIIGGGSRNDTLNQFTANSLKMRVVAGPTECTALGNIMVQGGIPREQIAKITDTKEFTPTDTDSWDEAYARFLQVVG